MASFEDPRREDKSPDELRRERMLDALAFEMRKLMELPEDHPDRELTWEIIATLTEQAGLSTEHLKPLDPDSHDPTNPNPSNHAQA